ncbi:hypothetical protein GGH99_001142, partial [Coemansia sp. RSA 1285]
HHPQGGNPWNQHPQHPAAAISNYDDDEDDHVPLSMMAGTIGGQQQQHFDASLSYGHPQHHASQPQHQLLQQQQQQLLQLQQQHSQNHGLLPYQQYAANTNNHIHNNQGYSYNNNTKNINNNTAPPPVRLTDPGVPQAMPPLDYHQQLEMELEHQQRQFQQQFLEQYHQMQMQQQQQPHGSSAQDWVDDGFADHIGVPASYNHQPLMSGSGSGFQNAPYNPNLPHSHSAVVPSPQPPNATGIESLYHAHHFAQSQLRAGSAASKPRTKDRPWVNNNNSDSSKKLPTNSASRASPDKAPAASSSSFGSEGSEESSETSSSDESAYNIDSDEEKPKRPVQSVPVSRAISTKTAPKSLKHLSPASRQQTVSSSKEEFATHLSGEKGKTAAGKPVGNGKDHADDDSSHNGDDDDDDLPLSVISSNSVNKDAAAALAKVRRTKSAMPATSPSPRSRYFGSITQKLSSMTHHGSLKKANTTRSKPRHRDAESREKDSCPQSLSTADLKTDPHRSIVQHSGKSADSDDNGDNDSDDDEDQPLDQIKSDLETGTKKSWTRDSYETGSAYSRHASSREQERSIASGRSRHGLRNVDDLDEEDTDASKKSRVLSQRQMKLLQTLKSGMAKAKHRADAADRYQQDSVGSERSGASSVAQLDNRSTSSLGSSRRSRAQSQVSERAASKQGSVCKPEERDSDNMSHNRLLHSRQSFTSNHTASPPQHVKSIAPKSRKEKSYLPAGSSGLPGLPIKSRAMKARAAVQYIALADIVENTERAQRKENTDDESGVESSSDHDIDGADKEKRLRRKLSRKGGDNAELQGGSQHDDAQSFASRNTASSSGGTLMELLRAGPVELLTASTEHSGSKAAIEMLSPEDYGDIDQLLVDLDGIMSGSLAARRRFSLAVMRRSIAVDNRLVEPVDYFEPDYAAETATNGNPRESFIEFKPLEIAGFDTGGASLLSDGLGLDNMLLPTEDGKKDAAIAGSHAAVPDISHRDIGNHADDNDTQPLSELAPRSSFYGEFEAQMAALDGRPDHIGSSSAAVMQPLETMMSQHAEQIQPRELTRAEKVNKALEKLAVLNVRKISIRIYVQDAQRYYTFSLTKYTTCELLIGDMRKSRIIDPDKDTWALFELVDYFGIERPLNHFENLMGIVESWEPRSNNYLVLKGYSQQSLISLGGGILPGDHAIQGMLYYRIKKSKWQKGVFRLQDHSVVLVKDSGRSKAKKEAHYLTLTNNDVYTPFEPLRGAPTRFVFGLKSEMPMQMFEKPDEDYVKWFAVHSLDGLREWLKVLRLSKNQIKFSQVLERRITETFAVKEGDDMGPSTKPLVDLSLDKHEDAEGAPRKTAGDMCAEMVSMVSKVATSSKYDPATLVKAVEQKGVDVSDLSRVLSSGANGDQDGSNDNIQAQEALFQPGSLLSKPKKSAIEAEAEKQVDVELFAKGSLLSQPRGSKALEASRAMQNVMAHNGNVFAQGSLLQVAQQTKQRPPHVGGAANVLRSQFPLMHLDQSAPGGGAPGYPAHFSNNGPHPSALHASPYIHHDASVPEDQHIFGGLLATASSGKRPAGEQALLPSNMYNNNAQSLHYR